MAYKALYRTYRPKTFLEVAGQHSIVLTLQNAMKTSKLSHAYLFTGPRGTGKTTMAKLFAKGLNCEEGIGQQCQRCENCLLLDQQAHPDVLEIDAASHNGVDEVRDLIDKVNYAPIKGRYKVYIIDEVHMMTSGAFNALLKTLEEPPAHVIFILATTEPHKIIPTILSRCQRYDFGKVGVDDIQKRIESILTIEKITIEPLALATIIELADGGMRDALSLLDQTISYANGPITQQHLLDLFGMVSFEDKLELLAAWGQAKAATILTILRRLQQNGIDEKRFINDLIDMLKDVLIFIKTKDSAYLLLLQEYQVDRLLSSMHPNQVASLITLLIDLTKDFRVTGQWLRALEIALLNTTSSQPQPSQPASLPPSVNHSQTASHSPTPLANTGESLLIDDVNMIRIMVDGQKEAKKILLANWSALDDLIFDQALGGVAALLKDGKPYVLSEHILVLEYENASLATTLNRVSHQPLIQQVMQTIANKPLLVYGVNRQESDKLKKLFMDLHQLGKLPSKSQKPPTVKNWTFSV